jgi:hypothetical protein
VFKQSHIVDIEFLITEKYIMKRQLLVLLLFFVVTFSFGQIRFEKGYFIDNNNQRIECLIRNDDWKYNPSEFYFKHVDSDFPEKASISSVKEFYMYGFSLYKRVNVKIDRSSNDINRLTNDRNPIWSDEQLFLKVLVDGKATLYGYEDESMSRFFYSLGDTTINQLVFKKYLDNDVVKLNNRFRQQLWSDVRCPNIKMESLENVNYISRDLEKYFKNYNSFLADSVVVYNNTSNRDFFNLKIATGCNLSSFTMTNNLSKHRDLVIKNDLNIEIGLETEFILPFKMNKWGILFEPTFTYLYAQKEILTGTATMKYKSIDFPIGLRHYFFLGDEWTAFLNASFISSLCFDLNSKIYFNDTYTLDIDSRNSLSFGGGVEKKRYSLEFRYYTGRELLSKYMYWNTDYNRFSIIFGYKLVKAKQSKI